MNIIEAAVATPDARVAITIARFNNFINDSLLVNRTIAEEPFTIEVKRFAEQNALMIVNNATEKLSLFELSEKGGEYRFEKEGEEVKQLAKN